MTTPSASALSGAEALVRPKLPAYKLWAAPLFAVASVGAFALVVNLVRLGFAGDWLDPGGYVLAILKPIALTFPGYVILQVVFARAELTQVIEQAAQALRRASLSVLCYAPVIWFYLLTSPTATRTFPLVAFSFGALAFWLPLIIDIARTVRRSGGLALSIGWIALLLFTEAQSLLTWLAQGIEGRAS